MRAIMIDNINTNKTKLNYIIVTFFLTACVYKCFTLQVAVEVFLLFTKYLEIRTYVAITLKLNYLNTGSKNVLKSR